MAENIVELLTDVADAIREKKGSNEPINAQSFANEIKNLPSGSSPFAVDFGEEIATGNPAFINALQEDIDYYNEVKARIASGESINKIWEDKEFKRRIAWIPPEMLNEYGLSQIGYCNNIIVYPFDSLYSELYNFMPCMRRLESLKVDASGVTRLAIFLEMGSFGDISLIFSSLEKIEGRCFKNIFCGNIDVSFPNATSIAGNCFNAIRGTRVAHISLPKVTSLSGVMRDLLNIEELYTDISSVTTSSYSIYGIDNIRVLHIVGMQCSLSLYYKSIELESVKFILDNCKAREDGASYTLTLNPTVKQNFLNKCTEGHEDYDAEYAASLASATEKGLTLA